MTETAPHSTTFLTVAGHKTELLTGGREDAPPLLYLHSAGGETDWTPFHDALARDFRVVAPAHPGFSYSEGLEDVRSAADMAWRVIDAMAELGLSGVPAVGFSLGGWIGAEAAILRPGLFSRLVLVNSAGVRVEGRPMGDLFQDDFATLQSLLFHESAGDEVVEQAMPLSMQDARILQWLKAREATARVGWNPYLHNPRLPAHLHRIECPTLVVHAREDRLLPIAGGELFAERIPDAELQVVEDAGHMYPWEQPDDFADRVREYVLRR